MRRAALVAVAALGAACGGPEPTKPPPALEDVAAAEGLAIVPESPVAVPADWAAEAVAWETVAASPPPRLGAVRLALLGAGPMERGIGRFWPTTRSALYAVRLGLANDGAETATLDLATAFVLVDDAGTPRALSAAAVALDPSPYDPVRLAPGDSAERILLFPLPVEAEAHRLEGYRGTDTAWIPLAGAPPIETGGRVEERPPPLERDPALGRDRSESASVEVVEYVPGDGAWTVHFRLEVVGGARLDSAVFGLWDGETRLAPIAHDAPAAVPAGGLVVVEARFPAPVSPIPRLEVALPGARPLRVALPAPASRSLSGRGAPAYRP